MKDFDFMLKASKPPIPKRGLGANFTGDVIARIDEDATKKSFRFSQIFTLRPLTILVAILIIVFTIGSITYAIKPDVFNFLNAILKSQTILKNGDNIVAISTKNCTITWLEDREGSPSSVLYYRLKKNSTLTTKELTQMVQGWCEISKPKSTIEELKVRNPLNTENSVASDWIDSTITKITPDSLSIRTAENWGGESHDIDRTFTAVDPHVWVESPDGSQLSWSDLKVGDHITFSYRYDESSVSSEIGGNTNTTGQTIVYVSKNTQNVSRAAEFDQFYSKEFVRVVPCDSDPTGYCENW